MQPQDPKPVEVCESFFFCGATRASSTHDPLLPPRKRKKSVKHTRTREGVVTIGFSGFVYTKERNVNEARGAVH